MALNPAYTVNELGMDDIVSNSRVRASASLPLGVNWILGSGTPFTSAPAGTLTLTAANMLTGICTINPSTANTTTFDTAANIVAAVNNSSAGAVIGDIVDFLVINGNGTNAITVAAGSGGSFDTNQANRSIPINTSKEFLIRLTNVTAGSEAYIIYF